MLSHYTQGWDAYSCGQPAPALGLWTAALSSLGLTQAANVHEEKESKALTHSLLLRHFPRGGSPRPPCFRHDKAQESEKPLENRDPGGCDPPHEKKAPSHFSPQRGHFPDGREMRVSPAKLRTRRRGTGGTAEPTPGACFSGHLGRPRRRWRDGIASGLRTGTPPPSPNTGA